jgi:hypothetical protein
MGDSMGKSNTVKLFSIIPLIAILVIGITPAFAGPVIIGGDDLTDHGRNTGSTNGSGACTGNNIQGWLYIENAVANLLRDETRAGEHDVDILAIGSAESSSCSGNAGAAAGSAAWANNATIRYCDGANGINQCFADLASGEVNPKMLHMMGTGASNDIDSTEGPVITSHAQEISDFVASGGGLLGHGSGTNAWGWLGTLLPGINFSGSCNNSQAVLTPEGQAAFPLITNANIRSGPCHNSFSGDFGGLIVLAFDSNQRAFILGLEGGLGGSIEEGNEKKGNGGDNQWDTRPTFGVSHETRQGLIVENGFSFNGDYFTVTDNHHTDFAEQLVEIGTMNSFTATVYADKKLKVQEFLFGIPNVGESHLAELGVEVWYDRDGAIEDIVVEQDTAVIDEGTISVSHEKTKCLSTDEEALCDTTTVAMSFNEPLKDKVMAIKAIDYANRDQRTYLNDGFDVSGESLNPMFTKMIPSNVKNQGLLEVTQLAKYSPYWQSADGRMFEMNSFGSFKEINQSFERFQDTGNAFTRMHSGFGGILDYEQNRATQVFDSTKLISDLPDSFGYHFEMTDRLNEQLISDMLEQQEIAKKILEEMDKQNRHY